MAAPAAGAGLSLAVSRLCGSVEPSWQLDVLSGGTLAGLWGGLRWDTAGGETAERQDGAETLAAGK